MEPNVVVSSYGPVDLLTLQGTPLCNLACGYCYISQSVRDTSASMAIETVDLVIKRLIDDKLIGEQLVVSWHSGEPLTLKGSYYEERMSRFASLKESGIRVRHSLQTNGTLLSDEHCSVFKEFRVEVGVSLDGPANLHDAQRPRRSGGPTHKKVMDCIARLKKSQIPFSCICVLTKESLIQPDLLYDFFLKLGCRGVGFNLIEATAANKCSHDEDEVGLSLLFENFLIRIWDRLSEDDHPFQVRDFADMKRRILRHAPRRNGLAVPLSNINVAWDGGWSTFCPELLNDSSERYPGFIFGNVHTGGFRSQLSTEYFTSMLTEVDAGIDLCRMTCDHFDVCHGGNPSNKLAENGSFRSADTQACRIRTKLLANIVLAKLENSALVKQTSVVV